MRRRNHYKFTEKKHSRRGMLSCVFAAASIFALLYTFYESFLYGGEGNVYLGCVGVFAMLVSVVTVYHAIKSLREEESYKTMPVIATILSVLVTGAWIALYVSGFVA